MRGYFFRCLSLRELLKVWRREKHLIIFPSFLGKIEVGTDNLNGELRAVH